MILYSPYKTSCTLLSSFCLIQESYTVNSKSSRFCHHEMNYSCQGGAYTHVSKTQKRINISTLANSIWSIPNVFGSVSMDDFLSIRIGAASIFLIVRETRPKDIERETERFRDRNRNFLLLSGSWETETEA